MRDVVLFKIHWVLIYTFIHDISLYPLKEGWNFILLEKIYIGFFDLRYLFWRQFKLMCFNICIHIYTYNFIHIVCLCQLKEDIFLTNISYSFFRFITLSFFNYIRYHFLYSYQEPVYFFLQIWVRILFTYNFDLI